MFSSTPPRRDAHDPRAPHRVEPPPRRRARSRTGGPVRLTARGAIVAMVLASFAAAMLASAVERPVVNGVGFVLACALASVLVRSSDLLTLSVSPPLVYFVAALAAEVTLTLGSEGFTRGVAIGVGTRLADVAPWLFAGTALVLVVTIVRGLPANLRDLDNELNGRTRRGPRSNG